MSGRKPFKHKKMGIDITMEDVIASKVIPNLDPMFLRPIGNNWFKNETTGIAYHIEKDADETVTVKETRQSISTKTLKPKSKPKPPAPRFTTIKCMDCGATREIHIQDAFQVKRCVECQKKHRKARRALLRKERQAQDSPKPELKQ